MRKMSKVAVLLKDYCSNTFDLYHYIDNKYLEPCLPFIIDLKIEIHD